MPIKKSSAGVYNNTFSGTDMVATIVFPNCAPITVGELATVSYSVYREKNPIRTLSRISVKGFTKGPRTVAGTFIFTVFDKHVVNRIKSEIPYLNNLVRIKSDELPAFDLYITMGNEYGASARLNIYGVTVVDEGKVMSIEDLFTENQWSYMARDIDLMDELGAEQNKPIEEFRAADETNGSFQSDTLVMDNTYEQMQKDLQSWRDAQKAKVEAERANEIKKYTYTVPDLSYKSPIVLVPDTGDSSDSVLQLTDEERAHLFDVNHPEITMNSRYFYDGNQGFKDAINEDSNTRSFIVWGVVNDKSYTEAGSILNGVSVGVSMTFPDPDTGENVTMYLGTASLNSEQHVIVDLKNYFAWTPNQPTINVYVSGHKTFEKDGVTYKLGSADTISFSDTQTGIQYSGDSYEIRFAWNESGSNADQVYDNNSGYVITINASAHNLGSDTTTTIYRDGIFAKRDSNNVYKTTDWVTKAYAKSMGGWTIPSDKVDSWLSYFNPANYEKTPYAYVNTEYFDPYFYLQITSAQKNGQSVADTKEFYQDLGFMTFMADIIIYADIGNGLEVVASGEGVNYNMVFPTDSSFYDGRISFVDGDLQRYGKNLHVFDDLPLTGKNNVFQTISDFGIVNKAFKNQAGSEVANLQAKITNWRANIQRSTILIDPVPVKVIAPDLYVKVGVLDETNIGRYYK